MKLTSMLLWSSLAVVICLLVRLRKRYAAEEGKGTPSEVESGSGPNIGDRLSQTLALTWQEIVPHLKLHEFIQFSGRTLGGEPFLVILEPEPNRRVEIVYSRVSGISHRESAGTKGTTPIPPNSSVVLSLTDSRTVVVETDIGATETPRDLLRDEPFSLAVSNVSSLTTGTTIYVAAKSSSLEMRFIKSWEIPASYADEALLASVSVRADVAHLAERIKDVQRSSAVNVPGCPIGPLKPGVCYVMGEWGGHNLSFTSEQDVALLIVESFNPELSLADFFEKLSLEPLMHARLVCREGSDGQTEPLLVYPDVEEKKHKLLNLGERNAVLLMHDKAGNIVEVLKIGSDAVGETNQGSTFCLSYLPSRQFQNVLLWCLPLKKSGLEPAPKGA